MNTFFLWSLSRGGGSALHAPQRQTGHELFLSVYLPLLDPAKHVKIISRVWCG